MAANLTPKQRATAQQLFLDTLRKCASVKQACQVAGVNRSTIHRWRQTNKTFRAAFEEAQEDANDTIDDEIVRRAIEGIEEPLVSLGQVVYSEIPVLDEGGKPVVDKRGQIKMQRGAQITTRKYSDTLLLALAKSRMKKYRERTDLDLLDQINEQTGGAISLNTRDLTGEEVVQLKQIGQAAKARQEAREREKENRG